MADETKVNTEQEAQEEQEAKVDTNTRSTLEEQADIGIPTLDVSLQKESPNEILSTDSVTLDTEIDPLKADQVSTIGRNVEMPEAPASGIGQVSSIQKVSSDIDKMTAAQIESKTYMPEVTGTLSAGALADPVTGELDPRATVQFQMEQLLNGMQDGGQMPPWASPAVRKIAGVMQSRGLGKSSMASAAMVQAVMESAIPIASADANKYAAIQLTNLNNQQKTALQNAAVTAAMDRANLNARLTSAVTNARALLAVDTANLKARQQAETLSYNALTQALFKDAAEENARRQFNAKNELQVEEFFAELGVQVETANANRLAAIDQFNVGQVNAMQQFNANFMDQREKFNANMQFAIDQSNVQWRRQINTANTALQNETNRINVQNQYNASQNAINNLWQMYRDNAAWNFQKAESFLQRTHELGIMAMEFSNSQRLYDQKQKDDLAMGVANWVALWASQRF